MYFLINLEYFCIYIYICVLLFSLFFGHLFLLQGFVCFIFAPKRRLQGLSCNCVLAGKTEIFIYFPRSWCWVPCDFGIFAQFSKQGISHTCVCGSVWCWYLISTYIISCLYVCSLCLCQFRYSLMSPPRDCFLACVFHCDPDVDGILTCWVKYKEYMLPRVWHNLGGDWYPMSSQNGQWLWCHCELNVVWVVSIYKFLFRWSLFLNLVGFACPISSNLKFPGWDDSKKDQQVTEPQPGLKGFVYCLVYYKRNIARVRRYFPVWLVLFGRGLQVSAALNIFWKEEGLEGKLAKTLDLQGFFHYCRV